MLTCCPFQRDPDAKWNNKSFVQDEGQGEGGPDGSFYHIITEANSADSPATKTLTCKPSTGRSLKLTFTIVGLSEKYWELESPGTQKLFSLCGLR